MVAVRGIGFSSWVRDDDADFEQLRRNLDLAAELGMDFVELPLFAMDLIAGGRILPAQVHRLKEAERPRPWLHRARAARRQLHAPARDARTPPRGGEGVD